MDKHYDFTIELTRKAGEMVKDSFHKKMSIELKGGDPRDIVTDVDLKVNDFVITEIKKIYPEYSIHSEEGGEFIDGAEYTWTIDPIDGTTNFSRGFYHFAVCIGLLQNGIPVVGAVYNPITDEMFSFSKDNGAFLNDEKIQPSVRENLEGSSFILRAGRKEESLKWGTDLYGVFLGNKMKVNNLGCSSLDLCFVASGRVEATIYGSLSTKDITCAVGILEESGGELVLLDDGSKKISSEPQGILAVSNGAIKEKLLNII